MPVQSAVVSMARDPFEFWRPVPRSDVNEEAPRDKAPPVMVTPFEDARPAEDTPPANVEVAFDAPVKYVVVAKPVPRRIC